MRYVIGFHRIFQKSSYDIPEDFIGYYIEYSIWYSIVYHPEDIPQAFFIVVH
jgi:hypothetical protein